MEKGLYIIRKNKPLTSNVYLMELEGSSKAIVRPGQFINILLEGFYLRRPISICSWDENTITIIYKVVGKGTEMMSSLKEGTSLDCLVGLGNGFDSSYGNKVVVVGGGVGVPPLYGLCKELKSLNKDVTVILGFNKKEEIFFEEEFIKLGCNVKVTTVDGSYGIKGFAKDAIDEKYDYLYTCGPLPMLKSLYGIDIDGQYSFEERMGCGFGACMGCSCKTKTGYKRVCKDGPIFFKEEIVWEK